MAHAGKRDRPLTIRRNTPTTDDFGGEVDAWSDLAEVWASKEDVSDGERARAQQVGASITTRFQIPALEGGDRPSVKDHVVCEGLTYQVVGVKEIGRRAGWEISAVAQNP